MSKVTLSSEQKIDMALSILGWSRSDFNASRENNTLKSKILEEISRKLISIPKDNNVAMNYSEQWAYGVLLLSHEI